MLDFPRPTVLHRCQLAVKGRESTAMTDQIALVRSCFAAERAMGPWETHVAVVVPNSLYILVSLATEEEGITRFKRLADSLEAHSVTPLTMHWPAHAGGNIGPFEWHARDMLTMPVQWGLCERPEDWEYSSIHANPEPWKGR